MAKKSFRMPGLLSVLILLCMASSAFAAEGLFSDLGVKPLAAIDAAGAGRGHVLRSRPVGVNFDLMKSDQAPMGAATLDLNLFDDLSLQAVRERFERRSDTRYTWFGKIAGVPISQVVLTVQDGVMMGNILAGGDFYQIRPVGDGAHAVRKIDQASFPPESPPVRVPTAPDQPKFDSPAAAPDDASFIDVLVVYTAAAASASGNILAEIQLGIDETNQSYANSGVNHRVRLAHAAQVNYVESHSGQTDLERLQKPSDGFMDEVMAMRDTYGADLVSLWVESMDSCGIGYMMLSVSSTFAPWAFVVVERDCATGYYSFGHEMGHNMGASHDRYADPDNGAYAYSHGYVYKPGQWRTVMAYNNDCSDSGFNCTRIPYWSNPNVNYNGAATGVAQGAQNSADNRLTLNNTALTVANFRSAVQGSLPLAGNLENPQSGKTVSGITTIHGWAIDGKGVTDVEFFIDGQWIGYVPYGGTRGDIQAAYPNYPNSEYSGFGVIFNYSLLSSGNHAVKVRLHNIDGQTKDLDASVIVKKFHGEFVQDPDVSPSAWRLPNQAITVGGVTKHYDVDIQWREEIQGYAIFNVTEKAVDPISK